MGRRAAVAEPLRVEIVFALRGQQELLALSVEDGATIADVIAVSGLAEKFPHESLKNLETGIWGHPAARDRRVRDGDRVEIYRSLERDPRDARRELAQSGLTMREPNDE